MSEQVVADDEIMQAVYRALCTNGYAELTMQNIADECSKSKSLLHYHYDTKADLLVAFLDDMLTNYEQRMECHAENPPEQRLVEFVTQFVFDPEEDDRASFHLALLEMRSQGPFNERIQRQLDRSDELLRQRVADILADGIEAGVFESVDVDRVAALLVATLDGARTRQITLDDGQPPGTYTRTVAEDVLDRIIDPLLTDDADLPTLDGTLEQLDD
jgi:AcrR family transcriptional regulator